MRARALVCTAVVLTSMSARGASADDSSPGQPTALQASVASSTARSFCRHLAEPLSGEADKQSRPVPTGDTTEPPAPLRITDAAVSDLVTGLVWERTPSSAPRGCSWPVTIVLDDNRTATLGACSRADAKHYCEQLDVGGRHDWRLPTVLELATFVDHSYDAVHAGVVASLQELDPLASFTGAQRGLWTSSPTPDTPLGRVVMMTGDARLRSADAEARVRCVNGSALPVFATSQRQDDEDAVTDTRTHLTWLREPAPVSTLVEATAFCQRLGYRLPSPTELLTVLDLNRPRPLPPQLFDLPVSDSWSLSPDVRPTATVVDLVTGTTVTPVRELRLPALCVHQ